jgi:hypothetical protein
MIAGTEFRYVKLTKGRNDPSSLYSAPGLILRTNGAQSDDMYFVQTLQEFRSTAHRAVGGRHDATHVVDRLKCWVSTADAIALFFQLIDAYGIP